jgi:hypothetical protein
MPPNVLPTMAPTLAFFDNTLSLRRGEHVEYLVGRENAFGESTHWEMKWGAPVAPRAPPLEPEPSDVVDAPAVGVDAIDVWEGIPATAVVPPDVVTGTPPVPAVRLSITADVTDIAEDAPDVPVDAPPVPTVESVDVIDATDMD